MESYRILANSRGNPSESYGIPANPRALVFHFGSIFSTGRPGTDLGCPGPILASFGSPGGSIWLPWTAFRLHFGFILDVLGANLASLEASCGGRSK